MHDRPIRFIIADDHDIIRHGLRSLLENNPEYEVAAEANNGRDIIQLTRDCRPDVITMDITMPELNGIEATRQILSEHPDVDGGFQMHSTPSSEKFLFRTLTSREREVLQLIAEGKSTKEIASLTNITSKTVEKHRRFNQEKTSYFNHGGMRQIRAANGSDIIIAV